MKSKNEKLGRYRFKFYLITLPRLAALLFIVGVVFSFDLKADKFKLHINADSKSCVASAEVNILKDDKLIYHFALPVSGTSEVELLWGNYNIQALNSDGCLYEKTLQIFENSPHLIQASLGIAPEKPTMDKNYQVFCFNSGSVCDGGLYPSSGEMLGQFQVYVTNPISGTSFTISPKSEKFMLLAAAPPITGNALDFNLQIPGFTSLNVDYGFLSYTGRFDDELFQKELGFCGLTNQVIDFMVKGLEKNKFPSRSIQNFKHVIKKQLISNQRHCIYPQLNKITDGAMPLKTEISNQTNHQLVRVFYVIVPVPTQNLVEGVLQSKYSYKPTKKWNHSSRTVIPKITTIYEWGIGYELQ